MSPQMCKAHIILAAQKVKIRKSFRLIIQQGHKAGKAMQIKRCTVSPHDTHEPVARYYTALKSGCALSLLVITYRFTEARSS